MVRINHLIITHIHVRTCTCTCTCTLYMHMVRINHLIITHTCTCTCVLCSRHAVQEMQTIHYIVHVHCDILHKTFKI